MAPHSSPRPARRPLTPAPFVLRLCLHLLMAGLLVLAAVRAHSAAGTVAAAVTGVVYAAGSYLPPVRTSRRAAAVWLGVLGASWLAMLWLTPEALWVAFPLYFLQLHLLPVRWSLPAVALTAGAAILSYVGHGAALNPGVFIGPLLGAAVAVATVLGYQALYRESERRRRLIEELIGARAELAAAERHAGTLAERERLAREIHDTLAQGLSSIQLLLRAAERALPPDSPAAGHIERARRAAQDNLAEARRFVRALTPSDLEHGSLAAALERLCGPGAGAYGSEAGPRVRFSVSGTPVELPTPYEVALLRIAQSALANTVRHASASRAEITLSFMDASVTLDVVDDGEGFEPGSVRPSSEGGFGLPAMRARAESLGGTFTVESAPGQGTAVAVSLPLSPEDRSPTAGGTA
ncbi:two-component sensor histidine kinase [Streptomyces cinereoruber]|uniref:Oxygen sensor histidine kinase NreB n=1 Tax=Streptomyces cinereoruber TaxID=67260 RepID=A0AAV4KSC9_9ACTN|nr:sensor histidine kinase [Streptomyces cinereoruber]MBB4157592.1 signal transduction histidine kinase [Streptomyces cinereoruber]MBY8819957.1 sensor histidine kinase [Streptomyces cinereoruber]NIH62255.1 signal transduction histidine kinase [Streptomyces cinereoruber]QEV35482.1 sensor histidine kinase [Streptomyces cinereoruber]GGR50670.1 two-component sensor histidine kinase [Streptomyces cinereoruber]